MASDVVGDDMEAEAEWVEKGGKSASRVREPTQIEDEEEVGPRLPSDLSARDRYKTQYVAQYDDADDQFQRHALRRGGSHGGVRGGRAPNPASRRDWAGL